MLQPTILLLFFLPSLPIAGKITKIKECLIEETIQNLFENAEEAEQIQLLKKKPFRECDHIFHWDESTDFMDENWRGIRCNYTLKRERLGHFLSELPQNVHYFCPAKYNCNLHADSYYPCRSSDYIILLLLFLFIFILMLPVLRHESRKARMKAKVDEDYATILLEQIDRDIERESKRKEEIADKQRIYSNQPKASLNKPSEQPFICLDDVD